MAFLPLLFVLVQSLIQYPQPAGDGLDEATHRRMRERQELLDREMARLLRELEQGPSEELDEGWGAALFGALQQWPFWVLAGFLLLLGLCFSRGGTRSREAGSSSKDLSSCKILQNERGKEQEEDSFYSKEGGEDMDVTVEDDDRGSGNDREGSPVAKEGDNSDATEGDDVKTEEDSDAESDHGYYLKKDEERSDRNVPGDNTAPGNEEEPDNVEANAEGLVKPAKGKTRMCWWSKTRTLERKKDMEMKKEKPVVRIRRQNSDDVNDGEDILDGKEGYVDVKVQESSEASEQRSSDWTGQEDSYDCGNEVEHNALSASEEEKKEMTKVDGSDRNKEEEGGVNAEANKSEERKEDERGNVAASETEGSEGGKEESGNGGREDREDSRDVGNKQGILLAAPQMG